MGLNTTPFKSFDDLMEILSIEFTNPFLPIHNKEWQDRENRFIELTNQYDKELIKECMACVVEAHESKDCDFLGEVFMQMSLNDKKGKAQVFTPYHIGELMSQGCFENKESIDEIIKEKGYISVQDPCVGGGCLLIACFTRLKHLGYNPQKVCFFNGCDLDLRCCRMAFIQLSILGAKARIDHMNSLTLEHYGSYYTPAFRIGGLDKFNMENIDSEIKEAYEPLRESSKEHLKKAYKNDKDGYEQGLKKQIIYNGEQLSLF